MIDASARPRITVVVPTYKEAENLAQLIDRVAKVRETAALDLDLLIVDDDSQDGSAKLVAARQEPWVRMIVRKRNRGLSASVLEGLRQSTGDILVCMDADLSHPPEMLPRMLDKLNEGADFVVGSRYAPGGTTSDDWGIFRWLNSRVSILLARPLTSIQDPMAGFFALRRSTFERATDLNPIGYKIGLELIVRCGCERVVEIPIHFEDRRFGESKLGLREQLLYLEHLRRLYTLRYGTWTPTMQFLLVGGLGTLVNLATLTLLLGFGRRPRASIAIAIFTAMCFNFTLNRGLAFPGARDRAWPRRFSTFVIASSIGAATNFAATLFTIGRAPEVRPQVAALVGIAAGTVFNFVASRYLAFRASRVRPRR